MIGRVVRGTSRILEELGRGTVSTTYIARDTAHDKPVDIRGRFHLSC